MIGEKLKKLRLEADKTPDEVATVIGITQQALWNYENNKRVPRDEIKVKLADYYGKSVEEIFF